MTLAWAIAKVFIVVGLLIAGFAALPLASTYDTSVVTIPALLWDPLVAVLGLDRYLPIHELLILAGLTVAIEAGLASVWIVQWSLGKLL